MWSDPIADMLIRIKNAVRAGHKEVEIYPASKFKAEILKVLKREGFIEGFRWSKDRRRITVYLKYYQGKPVLTEVKRVSKPGRRVYVKATEVPWVLNGLGIAIISTSRGVLSDRECRRYKVGGELICYVW